MEVLIMSRKKVERNIAYDDQKGKYYVTLNYGADKDGKWIKKQKTFKTLKQARECLTKFEADRFGKKILLPHEQTLGEFATYWLEDIKAPKCQLTTLYGYRNMLKNHIQPKIGYLPLQKLTVAQLNTYFADLLRAGLSNNTVKKHQVLLRSILEMAVFEEKIMTNPMNKVEKYTHKAIEAERYNAEQLAELLEAVKGLPLEVPVYLAGYLGVRKGEVNGLKWRNVNFKERTIYINITRTKAGKDEIIKETKTEHSTRLLEMTDDLYEVLVKEKEKQERNKELFKDAYEDNDYVFCKEDGSTYDVNYCSTHFRKLLVKKELPVIKFHALRHTFASIAVSMGEPILTVSMLLGHYSPSITAKYYAKVDEKGKARSMKNVSQQISIERKKVRDSQIN